jgi:TupA-like ATPgrasp
MIDIAERLGADFDHVRVDLYDCDDVIYVGELTLYSHSGLYVAKPDEADLILGKSWPLKSPARRALRAVLGGRREIRPSTQGSDMG